MAATDMAATDMAATDIHEQLLCQLVPLSLDSFLHPPTRSNLSQRNASLAEGSAAFDYRRRE